MNDIHIITKTVTLTRIDLAGGEPGPDVPARFEWESDQPLIVALVFNPHAPERKTWEFSRELLTGGLIRPTGLGDVRVLPLRSRIGLVIDGDDGQAAFSVSRDDFEEFLSATLEAVPEGAEMESFDWSPLAAWLGQEGAAA